MGLSSSSKTQTQTASPQAQQAASTLAGVYNANAGNTQSVANTLTGLVPGLASTLTGTEQGVGAASDYYNDVLSGKYLSGNPNLAGILTASDNAVTDKTNAAFSAAGRTGSGANTYALAKALSENENNLRYTDYNNQMSRMDSAASGAAGLNSTALASLLGLSSTATSLPLSQATQYAGGIGSLGLGGTTTATSNPSTAQNIGTGLQLASILFSDRRLKRGVRLLSRMADGLGLYRYRYLWSDVEHVGVMAQEVAALRPWALGPTIAGFRTVNYGAL
jgi:hypothetical protein